MDLKMKFVKLAGENADEAERYLIHNGYLFPKYIITEGGLSGKQDRYLFAVQAFGVALDDVECFKATLEPYAHKGGTEEV